ncbi:MAG: ABC transporter permease [Deltaproteobacteria bacterium]|jgi:putative ABC transport system permease protein|nr:ABC transporter permease [Deltaproteobacteria bacterium]MDL1988229.1 ABC transporter permease [Deltaproteobacteria bacterium]
MEIPLDLRLAVRNVFRNKVRSVITLAAIAFGCSSLIVAGGFFEDTFLQMREGVIHSHLGHIQVYKKGYLEKGNARPFDYMIENPDKIKKLISSIEHVKFITPRIAFSGLLSTGENTVSVIGQGVNPEGEQAISVIETVKGANTGVAIEAGENLSQSDMYDVILGRGLAKAMGSNVGDFIILVSNTVGGALNAMDMKVKGIFFTASKEFDDRAVRMPIAVAQTLLRTDEVQTLVVLLDKTENTDRVKKQLIDLVKNKGLDLEFKPWYELADFYNKTVELYGRQFLVLKFIIGIIVVLSIFNTINMSIWERTREIGTIMALGSRRREVLKLFLLEGLVLGILGGLIGIAAGTVLAYLISLVGIPMPPPPGATVGWTAHIKIVPQLLIASFSIALISSLVSSFYPAFKASRLIIADALRHF